MFQYSVEYAMYIMVLLYIINKWPKLRNWFVIKACYVIL